MMDECALTIGNFDGFHLGHQAVLKRLQERAKREVIFTFKNHPSEVLLPTPKPLILTPHHRLKLLKESGAEIEMSDFTPHFAQQSPYAFLSALKKKTGFTSLVLGHDGVIGHKRTGTPQELAHISQQLDFELEYLAPTTWCEETISSSLIRAAIEKGDFEKASSLLGRPYSICGEVIRGKGRGKTLGFPTANLDLSTLCLPPLGVYAIRSGQHFGIANLGRAPTVHEKRAPQLEVHFPDAPFPHYGDELDVVFLKFIRPEKKFPSLQALKTQIERDLRSLQLCKKRMTSPSWTV